MTTNTYHLPQLNFLDKTQQSENRLFITDGGLETDLIFQQGIHLPDFAAFVLLNDVMGVAALRRYFEKYVAIAHRYGVGLILESPTWRANSDWGDRLGYDAEALARVNQQAITLLHTIRLEAQNPTSVVISGCIGPRGDGYSPSSQMDIQSAQEYHTAQVETFALSCAANRADMVSALTMTYVEEAIGIAFAARKARIPVTISFTVETDGRLPSGQSLRSAIEQVDQATDCAPAYYMINCAHPTHFQQTVAVDEPWTERIYGIRSNASRKSHAELDDSDTLDQGSPVELGWQSVELAKSLPNLAVLGGCCGTDYRHIEAICQAYCSSMDHSITPSQKSPIEDSSAIDYHKEITLFDRSF
ncbi:Homocysteine S-methyltransferase, putative [Synechococcus sp. PCC 7335]|uniref:homocysteine S-methyltransferase family protein n=1 Tax=Synechococcus sp. (strain ATCC 29403 / PCC 7335) TaxID=91464 RepID=UPI00017EC022|nr:homocysteine S-methyltransferase family protein [Synechococcus sp. PCC 7335]EDX86981.1 Homocysteine S-methyltransferase, putative [Synechococcus sp. PCC 7335]